MMLVQLVAADDLCLVFLFELSVLKLTLPHRYKYRSVNTKIHYNRGQNVFCMLSQKSIQMFWNTFFTLPQVFLLREFKP